MVTLVDQAIALQDLVRTHADASERQRHLVADVAQAFAKAGLYRIAAPEDYFGSAADPIAQVKVIEAIARADASAAWNLMIGIESFGLIAPGFGQRKDLLADPDVVMCSSTAAVGRADKVSDGYQISGRWQFVSGCHNSQIFAATVCVYEDGVMQTDLGNRYVILLRPDWQILDTWHTSGLCGSGSHDVLVESVVVPADRLLMPLGGVQHDSPLLNFPLGARLAYNKVGVSLGTTRSAIEAFAALAEGKMPRFSRGGLSGRPRAQRAVAEAEVRLSAARALVMDLLAKMWAQVQAREHITTAERAMFQLACSDAVRGCVTAVDTLCEAAGTTANQKGHPLERIQRDVRVVGQHVTVAAHHIEDAGRILLGLPAQEMMLAGNIADT